MKRYLLFAGEAPKGGWKDFISSHATMVDALLAVGDLHATWWHLVDTFTGQIVRENK